MGTRLKPLTTVTNKHLLPVWNKPMIYWPIQSMVSSGIEDVMLVCGGNAAGEFLRILGNGRQLGLRQLAYTYQHEPKGIADALSLAEDWVDGHPCCVMLGDNILQKPFSEAVGEFNAKPEGARMFIAPVEHPEWYGVVTLNRTDGRVMEITEKPKKPKSNLVAIGLYMYDTTVWDYIRSLKPSQRNELEITDLNNRYLKMDKLKAHKIDGYWGDAGESIDVYLDTCIKVRELNKQ